jgi:phosphoserine phosphatase
VHSGVGAGTRGDKCGRDKTRRLQADAANFSILVGDSSADTPLTASVSLPKAISIGTQE